MGNNMRIAVCDDEQEFINSLKDAVYTYSNLHRLEVAIDDYLSGEDLLRSKTEYDMVLLDYKMGGIDGLETARILRRKNLNCTIIFLTSYPHFVYESFEVYTFRFFEKPIDIAKLYKAFDDYFEQFGNNYPLLLKVDRDVRCVHTNDIAYLEADNKKCYVNLAHEKLHCSNNMAAVSKMLPNSIFYKVSRAFIVNFNFIDKYDKEYIHFKNGETVPVSRKYMTQFKGAYRNYVKTWARRAYDI